MVDLEENYKRRLQVVFTHKMEERRLFMEELKEIRADKYKRVFKNIIKSIGPKWYQVLSTNQQKALDSLTSCIYKDLLEGRPVRTMKILRILGIYPRPGRLELLNCMFLGKDDCKQVLAYIFLFMFGHNYSAKLPSYTLNGKILLSSIYYLGLKMLIQQLEDKFKPDVPTPPKPKKPKTKPGPPLKSPYLQDMLAAHYVPKQLKRKKPLPLPTLDHLNEPYDETPPVPKPPPPPPPPPPPKKRLPQSYCDRISGYNKIEPYVDPFRMPMLRKAYGAPKKIRASKLCLAESKKKLFGLESTFRKPKKRFRRPKAPSTGFENMQYLITGVYVYNEKSYFILGSICNTPTDGEIIHGGHSLLNGEYVRIYSGLRATPPEPKADPCDCLKLWHEPVFKYLTSSKCYCGHYYDFGHEEGTFPTEDPPYFEKPSRKSGLQFNYANIFETNQKMVQVARDFKKHWETDSVLHEDDPDEPDAENKKRKKKVVKKSSKTCLGSNPEIEDYLRCALRTMRRTNIATRLPELHLAPELKEWMRYRIYGPYSQYHKKELLKKTGSYYAYMKSFQNLGLARVQMDVDHDFSRINTWAHKTRLNNKFKKYVQEYRVKIFRSHAYRNNLLWATMYPAKFPDKKFREIYFSYLFSSLADVNLIHPYTPVEVAARTTQITKRRIVCIPDGVYDKD